MARMGCLTHPSGFQSGVALLHRVETCHRINSPETAAQHALRGRKTVLPSVLGRLRFPLAIVLPLLRAEMESSPGFMGNPFGNMP